MFLLQSHSTQAFPQPQSEVPLLPSGKQYCEAASVTARGANGAAEALWLHGQAFFNVHHIPSNMLLKKTPAAELLMQEATAGGVIAAELWGPGTCRSQCVGGVCGIQLSSD